jgi:CDP-diacylglycerol--glycerol-3-phosphate 3-phosphatidyltransferase
MSIPFWILIKQINEPGIRTALCILAIFGAITDWADGFVARKRNEVTELGKIIDPLADKITIGAIIISLYLIDAIPGYYFYMIIGRDILIFLGGIYVTKKIGRVLPSNMLGKIAVSAIGIVILLVILNVDPFSLLYKFFFYISIVLILISFIAYIYRATEYIKKEKE